MPDNPWRDIPVPSKTDAMSAFRVDPDLPWHFFWARDVDRRCLLILSHANESSPDRALPKVKDILVGLHADGDGKALSLTLMQTEHQDIFYRLCSDIVRSTASAKTEKEAVAVALSRIWRWHHLLRGGSDGRLTLEEQKGVLGELLVLDHQLLAVLSPADSLAAWTGPHGAPKDFEVGRLAIESKARRGASRPFISISSEFQLDDSGVDALFVNVTELDLAPAESEIGVTLTEEALRIGNAIRERDDLAYDAFDSKLAASGFSWRDDYSDYRWVEGATSIFRVEVGFPRVTPTMIASGVTTVRYAISLADCEPFLIDQQALGKELQKELHGH